MLSRSLHSIPIHIEPVDESAVFEESQRLHGGKLSFPQALLTTHTTSACNEALKGDPKLLDQVTEDQHELAERAANGDVEAMMLLQTIVLTRDAYKWQVWNQERLESDTDLCPQSVFYAQG